MVEALEAQAALANSPTDITGKRDGLVRFDVKRWVHIGELLGD
jgi:hypothetical protein